MKTNLFLTIVSGLIVILACETNTFATKHRITVQDFQFIPRNVLNVHPGDTIHWSWVNGAHTTTSDTIPSGAAAWNHPIDISDTGFSYIPTILGTYKYHCTPHELSNMLGSFTVVSTAGISNKTQDPSITVYPDPFITSLTIHTGSADTFIRDLKIYDMAGNLVREISFLTNPGISDKIVNLSDLHSGIYLLEFIYNNNKLYSRKITKL